MAPDRTGLTEAELTSLARVAGHDRDELAGELRRRPWAIHDLLADPVVVDTIRDPRLVTDEVSPFLLFAVLTRLAADDLLAGTYVNDWVGPRNRLPVFDVEPLREFVTAPGRVLFVARLLASFVEPAPVIAPVSGTNPWELLDWLDAVEPVDRVALLRRLGDLSLFLAGVHADAHGTHVLDPVRAEKVGRSIGMTADEILALIDPDSCSPGLDTLEHLGARWYQEARRDTQSVPPIVGDIAERIHSARRFLTHLADRYLSPFEPGWQLAG
ncbi:MAG: hypothetical protein ACE5GB_01220 [Acidimicrobiales bacterium]